MTGAEPPDVDFVVGAGDRSPPQRDAPGPPHGSSTRLRTAVIVVTALAAVVLIVQLRRDDTGPSAARTTTPTPTASPEPRTEPVVAPVTCAPDACTASETIPSALRQALGAAPWHLTVESTSSLIATDGPNGPRVVYRIVRAANLTTDAAVTVYRSAPADIPGVVSHLAGGGRVFVATAVLIGLTLRLTYNVPFARTVDNAALLKLARDPRLLAVP